MNSKTLFAVLVCVLVMASPIAAMEMTVTKVDTAPQLDLYGCNICVSFFNEALQELIQIIADGGIAGGCAAVCGALPEEILAEVCDVICDFVGIEELAKLINATDPDPIFICQEVGICQVVDGGIAKITGTTISPQSGPAGTKFSLGFTYNVINKTGPGYLVVEVDSDDGTTSIGDGVFVDVQEPGSYQIAFQLDSTPSEDNAFNPGQYAVEFAVCEGDCTTAHKWGGIYDEASASFTITGN